MEDEIDERAFKSLVRAAAALNARQLGGRAGLPSLEEVESFLGSSPIPHPRHQDGSRPS